VLLLWLLRLLLRPLCVLLVGVLLPLRWLWLQLRLLRLRL
jgi:hypothetical protein